MTTLTSTEIQGIAEEGRAAIRAAFDSRQDFGFALYTALMTELLKLLDAYPERPPIDAAARLAAFAEGCSWELADTFRFLATHNETHQLN